MTFTINTLSDLNAVAVSFIGEYEKCKIFAFDGEMGVGKTTFISKLLNVMGVTELEGSPTYSIVNEYSSVKYGKIYHFDLFRLKNEIEALEMGIEEMLYGGAICFIEWPEKIYDLLPENTIWVYIRKKEDDSRTLTVEV
jgi:tRNA threonylcarbamoyladenosine biosynthesis protein TsaE